VHYDLDDRPLPALPIERHEHLLEIIRRYVLEPAQLGGDDQLTDPELGLEIGLGGDPRQQADGLEPDIEAVVVGDGGGEYVRGEGWQLAFRQRRTGWLCVGLFGLRVCCRGEARGQEDDERSHRRASSRHINLRFLRS
jgi:hypothetical protein